MSIVYSTVQYSTLYDRVTWRGIFNSVFTLPVRSRPAVRKMMAEPPSTPSRHEKSLGLLTIKFVNLLQEAQDGVLDLKVVSVVKFYIARAVRNM